MLLYSTKNKNNQASLQEAVMKGLPDDNGLYMPEYIPQLHPEFIQNLANYSFLEIAQQEDINTTTVKTCFAGASSLRFLKPETTREKIYILNGYLQIVEADGKITDEEKYACIQLCRDMELDINYLDAVLTDKNLASLG